MLILWTIIGAWHGADFKYIFSVGLLQFIYIFLGEIFEPLFVKLKKFLHINDKRVIMVPGNHDLDRSKTREYKINGIRGEYKANIGTIDAGVIGELGKDFDFYSTIRESFPKSLQVNGANPHNIVDMGISVNISQSCWPRQVIRNR